MHDDIDSALADEPQITPSSGFLDAVMKAVERETVAREPLQFPWVRALPGFLAATVAFTVAMWNGIVSLRESQTAAIFDEQAHQIVDLATSIGLQWVVLAVLITIISVTLPVVLVGLRRNVVV